jgi:beta-galactosidase beta subunit
MTVLEIMERTGLRSPGLVRAYIADALQEIQRIMPAKTTYTKYNVVAGTRLYSLPSNMETLKGVYRKFDSQGRYVKIGRVLNVQLEETSTAISYSSSTDIVVI